VKAKIRFTLSSPKSWSLTGCENIIPGRRCNGRAKFIRQPLVNGPFRSWDLGIPGLLSSCSRIA